MSDEALAGFVAQTAESFGVAGAAAGVWQGGREVFASHGVTSVENPLPVTPDTLFLIGSVTKTFTATAVMRLVADGKVALDAPVRRYVPELVLADEGAADQIAVFNLLNHTSGLDWGVIGDFGEGDDALARYVSRLAGLKLIAPPGTRPSYSQAGFNPATSAQALADSQPTLYSLRHPRFTAAPAVRAAEPQQCDIDAVRTVTM